MKHLNVLSALALVVLFLSACGGASSTETITLTFQPESGSKYSQRMNMDMDMSMMGQSVIMDMELEATSKFEQAGSDIGMGVTYDKLKMNLNGMGQDMSYDSEKSDASNPMSATMGALIGKEITMKMNKSGEVTNVEGLENLNLGSNAQMLESLKQSMKQSMAYLPKEPVKIGDTWENEVELTATMGIQMTTQNTWKLIDFDNEKATIEVSSDITMGGGESALGQMELKGTQTGTMIVNRATGITSSADVVQDMQMSMAGQEVEMKNSVKVELVKQ